MNLVAEETVQELPVEVPLSEIIASKVPDGILESLKAVRHEIALIHSFAIKEHNMIPSYLGGAYQAIDDAEGFLRNVNTGKEIFTPVPAKPVIKEENKVSDSHHFIKVPTNLNDIPYMQEWAGTCFFPKLRELTLRKDVEVSFEAERANKKTLQLAITVVVADKPKVVLTPRYKANNVINLAEVAKSIDAL